MPRPGSTYFHSSPEPTIGVEIELFIVDKSSYDLVSGAPGILDSFKDDPRVKPELLESIIEINTDICHNVKDVRDDLKGRLAKVLDVVEAADMSLISCGTHPFAHWSDARVTRNERYQGFLQRMQFPVRRLLITGQHVHIGVESGEKAVAIVNGLLRYIPHFIGLSANSPFWEGLVTGLTSTRMKVFEAMPTAGLPPRLTNYSEFQRFLRTLQRANAIESIREVWWDLRPHPGFGTVEIRAFDAVPTIDDMAALTALSHCLVVALSELYDNGQQLPVLSEWVVRENKWRAVRYGLDADIIIDDEGNQATLRSSVLEVLERLGPYAERLGCTDDLFALEEVVNGHPHYRTQLQIYEDSGDLAAVVKRTVETLKNCC
ncbi:MAG: glutamate--cysteine ligase [Fidelibacterota bacterium]|nr:MAG: glutamate--cysteine ligase [Candidatus Neomarinimicrobiota bacterium]